MASASSFKRLSVTQQERVTVYIEGEAVEVNATDSAASAVLSADLGYSRTTVISTEKRAPYCMMGVCFECLMTIDGIANTQGCMTSVKEGMTIERQHEARAMHSSTNRAAEAK